MFEFEDPVSIVHLEAEEYCEDRHSSPRLNPCESSKIELLI